MQARRKRRDRPMLRVGWVEWLPVGIFGALMLAGAVLFGAVDRWAQVGLAVLLTVGIFLAPPKLLPAGPARSLAFALAAILLAKEFLPQRLFGTVSWRQIAQGELGLPLGWTHHPEPARALDAFLVLLIAVVWFQWVRTLASQRERRVVMTWLLLCAGLCVAVLCFLGKGVGGDAMKIFGIRYTPGWTGWGPFPNRNHTACFLAMAIVIGLGCMSWAFAKRRQPLIVAAMSAELIMLVALLDGRSRGGLIALTAGAAFLGGIVLAKRRDRQSLYYVGGGVLILATLVVAFGGTLLERFVSREGGMVSNQMRMDVWKNAIGMWTDAPLFGHGVETFAQVFPLYQRLELDGQIVTHPESSWLLWLNEWGVVPLALGLVLVGMIVLPAAGRGFQQRSGVYLTAGAQAAVVTWLVHCVLDVPGHRWGTAGFALAALALGCPMPEPNGERSSARMIALVPAAIAAFWALPFIGSPPSWSPTTAILLEESDAGRRVGPLPTSGECEAVLRYFPMSVPVHQIAGIAQLSEGPPRDGRWQRHFEAVQRLAPGAWSYAVMQARATMGVSPFLGIHYWQVAVDRSGRQRPEMVRSGLIETAHLQGALVQWDRFIRERPELALAYARALIEELKQPRDLTRRYFDLWWDERAQGTVSLKEIEDFNQLAPGWVSEQQVDTWIRRHPTRRREDFRVWMRAFQSLELHQRAWDLYASVRAAPAYAGLPRGATREELEVNWRISSDNFAHARTLAEYYDTKGEPALMRKLVIDVATRDGAPLWFVQKGAHVLAAEGRIEEAVALALKDK